MLCTIDGVGLFQNITNKERLEDMLKTLDKREYQTILMDSLLLLVKCVLKSHLFEDDNRYFKPLQVTVIETKFAPSYAILFMSYLEDKIFDFFC